MQQRFGQYKQKKLRDIDFENLKYRIHVTFRSRRDENNSKCEQVQEIP